jgi:4-hydroxyphenylacetate 3-monooxygenase
MALMTAAEYRSSLDDGRRVWIGGERVERVATHPAFAPMVDAIAKIYALHEDPAAGELMTFRRPDRRPGSRFYKIPQTQRDLTLRRQMTSLVLDRVASTIDRFGDETVTPLFVLHDRADLLDRFDPAYRTNAAAWLDKLQRENLFMTSGNTDPKGDRSLQPYQQPDPDMYLRVVRETDAGIVISGAKFETGAPTAHVAFLKPTVGAWVAENRDYAVSCIVPLNSPGVRHICRMPNNHGFSAADHPITARFDEIDTLIVFDNCLVPWENVMFSRQPELAALMRSEFSRWAAQGYITRCLAKADLLVGTALVLAEEAGTINLPPVKSAISQLMMYKQTIEALLLAAEAACETTAAGYVMPNQAIQNAGRIFCSQNYNVMVHILREIAGGQIVMLPDQAMLEHPQTGPDIRKFFAAGSRTAEARLPMMHLARELTASAAAGRTQAYQLFAETPIFAQEAALFATYDRESAKSRARFMAGK